MQGWFKWVQEKKIEIFEIKRQKVEIYSHNLGYIEVIKVNVTNSSLKLPLGYCVSSVLEIFNYLTPLINKNKFCG